MGCCGRANLKNKKTERDLSYYEKFAYLTATQQQAKEGQFAPSMCKTCDALTLADPCIVCGNKKEKEEEKK